MKTRTPWWPLLRNELLLDHFPIIPLFLGGAYCLAIWFLSSWGLLHTLTNGCRGDIALFFSLVGDFIFPVSCGWLFVALMLTGIITVPGFSRLETYEFYFTRAIARRSLFRAKTMVLAAMLLGPLVLNMFIALGTPDLVLKPGTMKIQAEMDLTGGVQARLERYAQAFPGDHPNGVLPGGTLVLPGATLVYAGWLLWSGTLGLLAVQAYCAWMARHVTRRLWSVMTFVALPFLPASFAMIYFHDLMSAAVERSFLCFASHETALVLAAVAAIPIVEWWAERRFNELEIS
jgi:hypothetical protein